MHLDVDPASGEAFLTGDAVNTAARLQAAAPPGGVVVGELTHELTEQAIDYEELEPLTLKGKASRSRLAGQGAEVAAAPACARPASSTRPSSAASAELRALEAALDDGDPTAASPVPPPRRRARHRQEPPRARVRAHPRRAPRARHLAPGTLPALRRGGTFWALARSSRRTPASSTPTTSPRSRRSSRPSCPKASERPWLRQRLRPLLGLEAPQASREESFAAWTQFLAPPRRRRPHRARLRGPPLGRRGHARLRRAPRRAGARGAAARLATTRPELLARHPDTLEPDASRLALILAPLARRDASRLVSALLDERLAADVPRADRRARRRQPALRRGVRAPAARPRPAAQDEGRPAPEGRRGAAPARHRAGRARRASRHPAARAQGAALRRRRLRRELLGRRRRRLAEREHERSAAAMAAARRAPARAAPPVSSLAGEAEYLFWHALARDVAYEQLPRKARARKHEEAALWIEAAGRRARRATSPRSSPTTT